MKLRPSRRTIIIVLSVLVVGGGVVLLTYANCMKDWPDEVSKTDDTKQKLVTLRFGLPIIVRDEFTATTWVGINDMKDLAPHVVPRFERREALLVDGWGKPFIMEKRDQDDVRIVTIRSTRPIDRWWCN